MGGIIDNVHGTKKRTVLHGLRQHALVLGAHEVTRK